jgi:hypothetical protein
MILRSYRGVTHLAKLDNDGNEKDLAEFKSLLRNLETWSDGRRAEGWLEELLGAALELARQNPRPPYHACMDYSLVPHPDLDVYAVLGKYKELVYAYAQMHIL